MGQISDETKADVVLKALRDARFSRALWDIMYSLSMPSTFGFPDEKRFHCLIVAAERVECVADAAKYIRFIRAARGRGTIKNAAGHVLDESERTVLSRFDKPELEAAILAVEVMEE